MPGTALRQNAGLIKEESMDFIEQVFGFSPDGGSGSFEMALAFVTIGVVVLWRWARSARSTSR